MTPEQKEVLRQRKKLCLEIAEAIEEEFGFSAMHWDQDKAAQLIELRLPHTYAEAEAEMSKFDNDDTPRTPGPIANLGDRLRKALGEVFKDVNLVQCINAAVERLEVWKWADAEAAGQCWQCYCASRGMQHTNGPCRCTKAFKKRMHP